ncbi:hypothetical protein ACSFBM_21230 [Variovorax sp. GB1R11]|uniref:hypothetical protein n=1 Tax=Variovorax sp. GB1R11 TaxID=3443741 RepID=UPI003F4867CA
MIRRWAAALCLLIMAGCTTAPPVPPNAGRIAKGAKVGLLVYLPNQAQHMHVGTTVFNNFSNNYAFPWNPRTRTYEAFQSELEKAGFQVVRLSTYPTTSLNALAVEKDGRWIANPRQEWSSKKLREEQVAAVVVVQGKRTLTRMECTGGPCAESHMENSGLFTRGIFASTRYSAVPAMEAKVFVLDGPVELTAYEPLKTLQLQRLKPLPDFAEPKDLKQLTSTEFAPVASAVDAHIRSLSRGTAQALASGVN